MKRVFVSCRCLIGILILLVPFHSANSEHSEYSEYMEYRISWNYMTVGYSSLGLKKNVYFEGKKAWMFESTARTNSVIQPIFPVEDRIISFWDPIRMRTLWHEKSLSEGNYKRINRVHFNYDSKKAVWWQNQFSGNFKDNGLVSLAPRWKERNGVIDGINDEMQDVLSMIYIMRNYNQDPEVGQKFYLRIFDDNRFSRIWVDILDKENLTVTINGKKTSINTIKSQPKMETSGVFRSKGDIFVWISDDEERIPIKVEAEIPMLGSVTAEIFKKK